MDNQCQTETRMNSNEWYALSKKISLYKTEMCRSFEVTGFCKYGTKCQFAHTADELRPISRHPRYKTELCKTFYEQGSCPYGRRCCFIHNESEARKNTETNLSTSPSEKSPTDYETPESVQKSYVTFRRQSAPTLTFQRTIQRPERKERPSFDEAILSAEAKRNSPKDTKPNFITSLKAGQNDVTDEFIYTPRSRVTINIENLSNSWIQPFKKSQSYDWTSSGDLFSYQGGIDIPRDLKSIKHKGTFNPFDDTFSHDLYRIINSFDA